MAAPPARRESAAGGAAAAWRIDWLRRPQLVVAEGPPRALSRKDAALLAVLALDGGCARDTLAEMLWPAAGLARARANLRQRRFRLARSAGAALIEGEEILRLAAGVAHPALDLDERLPLDPAAADGDLLEGQPFDDCPEFARWLQLARERWRVLRAQALARVASRLEQQARLAPALAIAQRLADEEPLSDHAQRRLMRLHHLRGDLGAALDVYRRFAERLDAELGELPDDETAALASQLRSGEAPARARAPIPAVLRRPPRAVGREPALAALLQSFALEQCALIEGAPGVGKTRLLGDALAALPCPSVRATPGAAAAPRSLWVPVLAGDADRPYAVLVRLLSQLWLERGAPQPQGAARLPAWARRELATLLPEIGEAAPRADALQLQRAAARALQDAALALVVVDDVQQADAATLELLPALAGPGLPRWWLAVRSGETPPALQRWLGASEAPRALRLAALDEAQIAQLLADLALPGVDAAWAAALARHTGGLPLFVLETLRGLLEQPGATPAALPLTAGAAQAVRARAARLSEPARQLAQAAAVLGEPLDLQTGVQLLGAAGADPAAWAEAFAELEAVQWLDGSGRLHDLVAAALREAMPAAERRWLHSRIAGRLEATGAPPLPIALHHEAAGRHADAATCLEAAARAARRAARPAEDAALHQRAAAAWDRAGNAERAFTARIECLAPLAFAGGSVQALPLARQLVATAATPWQRMQALTELAHAQGHDGDHLGAVAPAREAWALAESIGSPEDRLKAAQVLVNQLAYTEAGAEALALTEQLLPLAEHVGGDRLVLFLNARSQALHRASRLAECAEAIRRALALLVDAGDWREAITVGGNLALVLGNLGRYEEAHRHLVRAGHWLEQIGGVEGTMPAGHALKTGHALLGLGRIGSAIAAYRQARRLYAAHNASDAWLVSCDHGLASAHLLRGDAAAAAACLRPFDTGQPVFMRVRRALLQAWVAAARGADPAPALAQARAEVAGSGDRAARAMVQAETTLLDGGADDPARLLAAERQQRDCEQLAIALRLAWCRVDALGRRGESAAAAALARELLAQPAWPALLLPAHWLHIAQRALAAVGDGGTAALVRRAQAAWDETRADLGALGGPPSDWRLAAPVTAG